MSNYLWPHVLQQTRLPCPSPSPRFWSNSCPLRQWCHPAISSSVTHFSSCCQYFSASVFSKESVVSIRWSKYWSFSFRFSLSNEYSRLISSRISQSSRKDLISLLSKGLWIVFSRTTIQKHQFFYAQPSLQYNSHILHHYWKNFSHTNSKFWHENVHTHTHTLTHLWKHSLNRIKENMNEARYQVCYFELLESDVHAKVKMKHLCVEEDRREEGTPSNWEQRTWQELAFVDKDTWMKSERKMINVLKIKMYVFDEHRCRNSEQYISKLNSTM